MRIGCLGLSANPPHRGHRATAKLLLASGKVDQVWLIPVFAHPFQKAGMESWEHRLYMCRLLEGAGIWVSSVEQEIEEQEHHGASYTIFTVRYLQEKFSSCTFFWCIGSDIVLDQSYLQWHKWAELQKEIEFFVTDRPGYSLGSTPLPPSFTMVPGYTSYVSSSIIRQMIREEKGTRKDLEPYVDEEVAQYIIAQGLYKPKKEAGDDKRGKFF